MAVQHIAPLPYRFDTDAVQTELQHCMAWDQYRFRTEHPRSPHREALDCWLRYNAIENFGPAFNEPHESVWYPVADRLPETRNLIERVLSDVGAYQFGGVLVTKIPQGKQVYPHVDRGWHAEHYEKFAVLIEGNSEQAFCFDDGEYRCNAGDAFTFNNQYRHWVLNPTNRNRMTLIICARRH